MTRTVAEEDGHDSSNSAPAGSLCADFRRRRSPLMDIFLTPRQTAAMLGLTVETIARYRCKGMGPAYHKFGGNIRYRLSDIREWTEKRGGRTGRKRGRPRKRQVDQVDESFEAASRPR